MRRADLDGLRALAVLAVVLFHAGVLAGGFAGVDAFFVLSGYLMARMLRGSGSGGGGTDPAAFWARRLSRLVPAFAAMALGTTALAWLWLLPGELREYGQSLTASALGLGNVQFWRETGYFAPAAHTLPLLHAWSLGVEVQAYALAPLAARLPWRALAALGAASLAAAIWAAEAMPAAGFYLLPFRAWEFLAGAAVALAPVRPRPRLAWAALAALIPALALAPQGPLGALAPVVATAALIWAAEGTGVGRLLGCWPLRRLGEVSYGLYLWHWPLFVLGAMRLGPGWWPALALAALALAVLSHRLIEAPGRRVPAAALAAGCAALAGLGLLVSRDAPGRLPAPVLALAAAAEDVSPRRRDCHATEAGCTFGAGPPLSVWGDSHGVELAWALGATHRVHQRTQSSCPPILGLDGPNAPGCAARTAAALEALAARGAPVVLAARWDVYIEGHRFAAAGEPGGPVAFTVAGAPATPAAVAEALAATVGVLRDRGLTVLAVGPIPHAAADIPAEAARAALFGRPARTALPRDLIDARTARARAALAAAGAAIVDPRDVFCDRRACRALGPEPLYFDDDHPSLAGARRLAAAVEAALLGPVLLGPALLGPVAAR